MPSLLLLHCSPSAVFAPVFSPARAGARRRPIALVPHRAIYDLSLGETRGNSQIAGVRGRILYDFGGNACEGYSLEFRQVSELDSGEGKVSTSDLRSTTWEGADAKSFKFTSENFVDRESRRFGRRPRRARAPPKRPSISASRSSKNLDLDAGVVFPTEHMVRAIAAARAGKNILDFPVYDGSETGDKVFDTLTVIGHKIAPDERKHDDAAANEPKLADGPALAGHDQLFRHGTESRKTASKHRITRSASSSMRTAFRAL